MAVFLLPQEGVQGQLTPTGLSCLYSAGYPGFAPQPVDCSGAWDGNNKNQWTGVWAQIALEGWGTGWTDAGSTDSDGSDTSGPFQVNTGSSAGTLTFKTPFTGQFILILKAANAFSMYLFPAVTGLTQIDYVTDGVSLNQGQGTPNGLSHATLLTKGTSVVPEPSTIILLGTGLLGLGLVGYRRRDQA
jgi:hypothetical protein